MIKRHRASSRLIEGELRLYEQHKERSKRMPIERSFRWRGHRQSHRSTSDRGHLATRQQLFGQRSQSLIYAHCCGSPIRCTYPHFRYAQMYRHAHVCKHVNVYRHAHEYRYVYVYKMPPGIKASSSTYVFSLASRWRCKLCR